MDAKWNHIPHTISRRGKSTVMTVRPDKAEFKDGEIADYQLVFKAGPTIKVGAKYSIRARLEVSDKPLPAPKSAPR